MRNKGVVLNYIATILFVILVVLLLGFLEKEASEQRRVKAITDSVEADLQSRVKKTQGERYDERKHDVKKITESRFQPETITEGVYDDNQSPFLGNVNGENVVAFFTTYNCTKCMLINEVLEEFITEDPEGKVVIKLFSLDGKNTQEDELSGLALYYYKPNLYADYHREIIEGNKEAPEILSELGVTINDLQPYMALASDQLEKVGVLKKRLLLKPQPVVIVKSSRGYDLLSIKTLLGEL
ncbi:hypothetical protein AB4391_01630 [Vibrio lentus]|uniref:Thioredoxin-like fold domain-containing protein n=1 Tax=Vibrio lentus TaxID=136468 RepID=A0A2N7KGT1_9VIBR|nr:hypothetical protein [Vibrio lentus]PMM75093.1 hypothetical protein BCT49_01035 [Vibrio lentus]